MCPKGVSLDQLHNDPDRLRRPLIKRNGVHIEVGWEEAYAEVEKRLLPLMQEFGRDAVGVYLGNPNAHNLAGSLYVRPLIKALRTRNIFSASTVDQMPRHVSSGLMFGSPISMAVPDLDHTKLLLLLGTNPFESNGSLCTAPNFPARMLNVQKRGGKVIVIDPRKTRTAKAADEHISIQPGTDAFLLVAMLQYIFENDLVDLGRVGEFLDGLDEVRLAVAPFSPQAGLSAMWDLSRANPGTGKRSRERGERGHSCTDRGSYGSLRDVGILGHRYSQYRHGQSGQSRWGHVPESRSLPSPATSRGSRLHDRSMEESGTKITRSHGRVPGGNSSG